MNKKLYKSKQNKILGGVCWGLAEYMKIDPTIIRLVWILLAAATSFFGGTFVILYIIAWIIIPTRPEGVEETAASEGVNKNMVFLIGGGLVIFGIVKILEKIFDVLNINFMLFGLSISVFFWPAAFILAGLFVIFVLGRKNK
jgi:phage shock protein C